MGWEIVIKNKERATEGRWRIGDKEFSFPDTWS